ncbi:hypothetical protein [Selenomonas sp. F0473]|uniref:hypothetical protein n=1 Tax=Selenomonas sp. F0473 TaxID=999423 RepID=UPI001E3EEC15|nr:hypothetical protein [Selenomonas sp. F0473]
MSGFLWGLNNYLYAEGAEAADMAAAIGVGIMFSLACTAVNDMSAALALLAVNGCRGALSLGKLRRLISRPGAFLCAAALLGGPLGQLSYCLGILWAGPTYALAVSALYPVLGCILAKVFLRQAITGRMAIGILLAVLGAVVTGYTPTDEAPPLLLPGICCAFFAALCWGSEIVLAVRGMDVIPPDVAITLRECISGTVLLFMAFTFFPVCLSSADS